MIKKFDEFLNENNSDNYIDFSTTNLEEDFKLLNSKLFGNQLETVPLKWMKSKNKLGVMRTNTKWEVSRSGRKKKIEEEIVGVGISTFYKLTRQQYLDVLAHEMIHVWISQMNIKDNKDHGRRFISMMYDINRRFDSFNVKPSEDSSYYAVNTPDDKVKEMGVLLFETNKDNFMLVTSEKAIEDRVALDEFIEKTKKRITSGAILYEYNSIQCTAYKVKIKAITTFKYMRDFNSKTFTIVSLEDLPELEKQIKANNQIVSVKMK